MNNLCFGMKVINITQLPGGSYSHPNQALDMSGVDSGVDFWFAQGDWKCIAGSWGYGTFFFIPVDRNGNTTTVHCADGIDRVVTIALTHSTNQFVKTQRGKIYRNGEPMYEEGMNGKQQNPAISGNHIHVEVAEGIQKVKYKGSDGIYRMNNELKILDVFYVNDAFSRVSESCLGKLTLHHCASLTYDGNIMNGIDISNWQKDINLKDVLNRTNTGFVIAKVTEGVNFVDKYYHGFLDTALSEKKCIGFYHFAHPENNSAEQEAMFFYENAKDYFGKGIAVLDWESSGQANTMWAEEWLDRVYNLTGIKPIIYMSESVVNSYDWSRVSKVYDLWVAKYADNQIDYNYDMSHAGSKPVVKYWTSYIMWQWTSSGRLNGYLANLDCNVFYGNKSTWAKYSEVFTGWKLSDNHWYYFKDGKYVTGWQKLKWSGGKSWFYFDKNGIMLTGLQHLKWRDAYNWYYFDDKTGAMKTGEQSLVMKFNDSGKLVGGKKA